VPADRSTDIRPGDVVKVPHHHSWPMWANLLYALLGRGGHGRHGGPLSSRRFAPPASLIYKGRHNHNPVLKPNAVVTLGNVEIGNAKKLTIIAGPASWKAAAMPIDMAGR